VAYYAQPRLRASLVVLSVTVSDHVALFFLRLFLASHDSTQEPWQHTTTWFFNALFRFSFSHRNLYNLTFLCIKSITSGEAPERSNNLE